MLPTRTAGTSSSRSARRWAARSARAMAVRTPSTPASVFRPRRAVEDLTYPEDDGSPAAGLVLCGLGLRWLAARGGVPPRLYALYGAIAAPGASLPCPSLPSTQEDAAHPIEGAMSSSTAGVAVERVDATVGLRWPVIAGPGDCHRDQPAPTESRMPNSCPAAGRQALRPSARRHASGTLIRCPS